jgi:hypothetical protein
MKEGLGTYKWGNGEKYDGEWSNNSRNGKGRFYNSKGNLTYDGSWQNDKESPRTSSTANVQPTKEKFEGIPYVYVNWTYTQTTNYKDYGAVTPQANISYALVYSNNGSSANDMLNRLPNNWRRKNNSTRLVGAVFGGASGIKTDSGEGIYEIPGMQVNTPESYVKEKVRNTLPLGSSMHMNFLGKINL